MNDTTDLSSNSRNQEPVFHFSQYGLCKKSNIYPFPPNGHSAFPDFVTEITSVSNHISGFTVG